MALRLDKLDREIKEKPKNYVNPNAPFIQQEPTKAGDENNRLQRRLLKVSEKQRLIAEFGNFKSGLESDLDSIQVREWRKEKGFSRDEKAMIAQWRENHKHDPENYDKEFIQERLNFSAIVDIRNEEYKNSPEYRERMQKRASEKERMQKKNLAKQKWCNRATIAGSIAAVACSGASGDVASPKSQSGIHDPAAIVKPVDSEKALPPLNGINPEDLKVAVLKIQAAVDAAKEKEMNRHLSKKDKQVVSLLEEAVDLNEKQLAWYQDASRKLQIKHENLLKQKQARKEAIRIVDADLKSFVGELKGKEYVTNVMHLINKYANKPYHLDVIAQNSIVMRDFGEISEVHLQKILEALEENGYVAQSDLVHHEKLAYTSK